MLTPVTLSLAAAVLAALAVVMAFILGWANRAFHVEVDPKVEAINEALPGANCGGCGFVGCQEYAEAVVAGNAELTLCAPGGAGCVERMASIMGVEVTDALPYRPVIHCAADRRLRLQQSEYRGEKTCVSANLVAGVQGCTYGCLGFGDCMRSCKYDAISIVNGLSVIDYSKCVGCKACAKVCPRNIITMVPFKTDRMFVLACSNKDFGPEVKKVCKVGCIGCKACTRQSEMMVIGDEPNLPRVDYEKYDPKADFQKILDKCPMQGLFFVGKPSKEDQEKVADEEVPDMVEAEFKTTVDDTEWRG